MVSGNNLRILAIDDNSDNLTVLAATLSVSLPEAVLLTARDGRTGIELAESADPDVILLDIVMPGMDGFEVCRALKSHEHLADIPVVFLTAMGTDNDTRIQALELGAEGFLSKPVNNAELTAQILAMTKIRQANRAKQREKESLASLVAERTQELEQELELRKQAEVQLRDSEQRYRSLIANAPVAIAVITLEGSIVEANRVCLQMLGYASTEEFGSIPLAGRYVNLSDRDHWVAQVLADNQASGIELQLRKKDGTPIWVSLDSAPLPLGRLDAYMVVMSAIGERRAAQDALTASTALMDAIFNSTDDAITVIDAKDLTIVKANAAFLRQCGAGDESDVIGKHCYQVSHHRDQPCMAPNDHCPLKDTVATRSSAQAEHMHFTHDDRESIIDIRTFPLFDETGEVVQIVHATRDITERRLYELDQQRSAKLESVGILAGGIAHDFNNILTSMMGNIGLAIMSANEGNVPETVSRLGAAEMATIRAKDLTQQLLTFSRGGAPIKKTVAIGQLLRESTDFALRGCAQIPVYSIADDLWAVLADEGQIHQVISNIIINAREAMPEGGIIRIGAGNLTAPGAGTLQLPAGNYVEITIKDQGVGISRELLQRIFEPYFTTKQTGSGLGLATSHSIVKNHGGYLTVDSVPAEGATFHILLPALAQQSPRKDLATIPTSLTGQGRLLVMDDEPMIRELLSRQVTRMGYEVELAKDGAEAIELYKAAMQSGRPFAAVIMDLTIPGGMGGKEAIGKLLELDPAAVAIVSSGYSNDPVMADYKTYGFSGVAPKPYKMSELHQTIANAIQLQRTG